MAYETIDYATDGAIARITLNRPERLNAINTQLVADLRAAVIAANDDRRRARARAVSGAGRAFCAGYDLDWGTKGEDAIAARDVGHVGSRARLPRHVAQRARVHVALGEPEARDRAGARLVRRRRHGPGAVQRPDLHGRGRADRLSAGARLGRADDDDVGVPPRPRAREAADAHRRVADRRRGGAPRAGVEGGAGGAARRTRSTRWRASWRRSRSTSS